MSDLLIVACQHAYWTHLADALGDQPNQQRRKARNPEAVAALIEDAEHNAHICERQYDYLVSTGRSTYTGTIAEYHAARDAATRDAERDARSAWRSRYPSQCVSL